MRQPPLALGVLTLLSALQAPAQADAGASMPSYGQALESF